MITQEQARACFLKAKIYRFIAVGFGFVGVLIVVYFYSQWNTGNFFLIFKEPLAVAIMVLPFIPALVFSFMARRLEAKVRKFLESLQDSKK